MCSNNMTDYGWLSQNGTDTHNFKKTRPFREIGKRLPGAKEAGKPSEIPTFSMLSGQKKKKKKTENKRRVQP